MIHTEKTKVQIEDVNNHYVGIYSFTDKILTGNMDVSNTILFDFEMLIISVCYTII